MTRMTGPDCAVMCNLINIRTYIHTYIVIQNGRLNPLRMDITTEAVALFKQSPSTQE